MARNEEYKYGWHWLNKSKIFGRNWHALKTDRRQMIAGRWFVGLTYFGNPVRQPILCAEGMHAWKNLSAAAYHGLTAYSTSSYFLCYVKIKGAIESSSEKTVGTHRKVEWYVELDEPIPSGENQLRGFRRQIQKALQKKYGIEKAMILWSQVKKEVK